MTMVLIMRVTDNRAIVVDHDDNNDNDDEKEDDEDMLKNAPVFLWG